MGEKPIKVDEETDRLVTDLAHFLECTKKAIVREAVADFAEARRAAVDHGDGAGVGPADDLPRSMPTFAEFPVRERLALRRTQLIREVAKNGGSNIRLLGPLARGDDADIVELLVDTDIMHGSGAVPTLQSVARQVLAAPVHVTSTTALSLFEPDVLERLLAESRLL